MAKLSAAAFAAFLMERYAKKDGYIMGSRGENPRKWSIKRWPYTQYSGAQLRQAKKWREKCERVWDCQGMCEGYINDMTSKNIDVRARNNYASWCAPKGSGVIPAKYRVKGAAVFKDNGSIHHVGYLVEPVNPEKPMGDWWIIEAKGVMYGVVRTKLSDGGWNKWGLMTKYFSYDDDYQAPEFGERELTRGDVGEDVRELQGMLIELGFTCGRWGTDGDYGPDTEAAVKAFQTAYRLPVTGKIDADDFEALRDGMADGPDEPVDADPDEDAPDEPEPVEAPAPSYDFIVDALDLSSHNSAQEPKIDWQRIKDGVGFLIMRCGCTRVETKPLGVGKDAYFEKWAKKCNEMGIPFWVYYFSNAASVAQAREEAEFAYNIADKYGPVGYCMDCEKSTLNRNKIEAWYARMAELTGGKRTMIYVAHHLYNKYDLPEDADGFLTVADAVWPPRYGQNDGTAKAKYTPKMACDLWQYTSVYSFKGIPDKTLDANKVTGQRRTLAWFRGEDK